jgi:hypothetical protein
MAGSITGRPNPGDLRSQDLNFQYLLHFYIDFQKY